MCVRFYDNMNQSWRNCWGERRFKTLEEAMAYGELREFEKLTDHAYISKPVLGERVRVKILYERDA